MKTVAIIGGGYTGLVAAYRLAQAGCKVTILERNDNLGGLASGFSIHGSPLERAYHHLFKTDTSIINLTKELGIGDKLQWHDSSVATYYKDKMYPFMTPMDLLKFTPLTLPNRIRAGLVVLYLQKQNNWHRFEHITAYDWMLKYAGKQVTKVIWEPLLRGKFDAYYNKVAMAWLWARVHVRANSREPGDSGEKLGYFNGGFQLFTDTLTKELKDLGVIIKTGVGVDSISTSNAGKVKVVVDGKPQQFDACLATTPSHVFSKLIQKDKAATEKYIAQLNGTNYLGALLLIFSSKQDISKYYWHNINDINLPFLVFINHTKLISKKFYGGNYVYYVGAYLKMDNPLFAMTDEKLKKLWFDSLKKIFPNFDRKKVGEEYVFRFANAQHIVDTTYRKNMPKHKTPLKNVYLANFAQIFPEDRGTNYAVRDGEEIAKSILTSMGKRNREQ